MPDNNTFYRVLVVDDEESIRYALSRFLSVEGCEVDTCSNFPEAVKFIEASQYDLIFVDLALSDQYSGESLLNYLYQTHYKGEVVLISARIYQHPFLSQGIHQLQKPFTRAELVAKLQDVMALRNHTIRSLGQIDRDLPPDITELLNWLSKQTGAERAFVLGLKDQQPHVAKVWGFVSAEQLDYDATALNDLLSIQFEAVDFAETAGKCKIAGKTYWHATIFDADKSPHAKLILQFPADIDNLDDVFRCFRYIARDLSAELEKVQKVFLMGEGTFPFDPSHQSDKMPADAQTRAHQQHSDVVLMLSKDGRISAISKVFESISGLRIVDFKNQPLLSLFSENDRLTVLECLQLLKNGYTPPSSYLNIRTANGIPLKGECSFTLLAESNEFYAVMYFRPLTSDRKLLDSEFAEELLHVQKIKEMGQVTRAIAHDFNNILTAINGYAELILRRLPNDKRLTGEIEMISKAAQKAASLTRQMLVFGGKQPLKPRFFNLNEVISEFQFLISRLVSQDIQISFELAQKELPVYIDGNLLEQVLLNLVVNARDAISSKGHITVATGNAEIESDNIPNILPVPAGKYAFISVEDDGKGIREEDFLKIFEPDFTSKTDQAGKGIGLSIVYDLVKRHSGGIRVESQPGKYTRFTIFLPLVESVPLELADFRPLEELAHGTEHILVMEKDPMVRALIVNTLALSGFEVNVADDPSLAEKLLKDSVYNYDMIVINETHLKNEYVVQNIIKPAQEGGLAMLVISGTINKMSSKVPRNAKILYKPFTPFELAKSVRAVLDTKLLMPLKSAN
jgi:signal transduction histidine kinase/DNA-binding response OmpR family regulator